MTKKPKWTKKKKKDKKKQKCFYDWEEKFELPKYYNGRGGGG